MAKLSVSQVADIVEAEGLGYAIKDYLGAGRIADPELAAMWDEAKDLLIRIEEYIEMNQGDGDDDETDEDDEDDGY
jgi:hypothetical protein